MDRVFVASQELFDVKKLMLVKDTQEENILDESRKENIDDIPKCAFFVNEEGSIRLVLGDGHHRSIWLK